MTPTAGSRTPVVRGTAGLAVAMGLGRFFYTPVLPLMVGALSWSGQAGAWVATANYLGYFAGSFVVSRGWVSISRPLYRASLVATTLLLALVAVSGEPLWQAVIRLLAGAASALVFVSITQHIPAVKRRTHDGGVIYAGVGTGILVSGAIVVALGSHTSWQQLWLIAAAVSAVAAAVAWHWPIPAPTTPTQSVAGKKPQASGSDKSVPRQARASLRWLSAGYFFQGAGYIIIGTYLVVLAQPVFGETASASTWLVAGLATAPAPLAWSLISARLGTNKALAICYSLQVTGAVLAVFSTGPVLLVASAALFGATFMGVTMLTISAGLQSGVSTAAATLTTWYSVGQIVGPALIAVALSDSTAGSFIVSAVALAIGMVLTLSGTARIRPPRTAE